MTISEETMNMYQWAWHYLGLWSIPVQPRHPRYTVYSVLINFTPLIVFNGCLLLSMLVSESLDDVIETLLIASSTVMTTVKVLVFITSRRYVSQLIYVMKLLETFYAISPHERSILLGAKRKSALARIVFFYCTFSVLAILILNTFTQPKRSLIWSSLYPFDWRSNIAWYGLAMIFQVACTSYILIIIISVDMWRVAAFLMLNGFLDVLCGRMQRLGKSIKCNLKKTRIASVNIKQNRFHEKQLIDCVKYHLLCIRYCRILENASKLHYFLQLAVSTVMIGTTVYLLTTFQWLKEVSKFIWLFGCLISCCLQLAIPCYLGSMLADKTGQLSFSLYESNWPEMSPEFKSTMSIVLEVTREPIEMCTFWNLFIISLPTFVRVVRSAYSMMSFLKGMQQDE